MTQATTLDTFKNFLEKYSLKQSTVARGMGVEKATLNHYLVKGTRRNKFYERALLDLLAQMRYDIDQVFATYMSDDDTIKLGDSSRNPDYSVVTVTYTREEWEKMQASDATIFDVNDLEDAQLRYRANQALRAELSGTPS